MKCVAACFLCLLLWLPAFGQSPYEALVFDGYRPALTRAEKAKQGAARNKLNQLGLKRLNALMDFVHVKNIMIRIDAYMMVLRTKDEAQLKEIGKILVGYLDNEHSRTRKYAAFFLSLKPEMGDYADEVRPLLANDKERAAAIRALGKWGDTESLPEILKDLKHDEERRRITAANALRDIGDASTIDALFPLLEDEFFTVRCVAERALVSFGDLSEMKLIDALKAAKALRTQRHLVSALGAMRSNAAKAVLENLKDHEDWGLQGDVRRALNLIEQGAPEAVDAAASTEAETHAYIRSAFRLID